MAVKDSFDVAGEPTRHGSNATPPGPVQADDPTVSRLREAGAVIIGKTTMPELAIFGFTESAASGVTRNPWNPQRSPGGSSGGGAVAVATGMAPLALATDGLGSIRIPSAFCGVFGVKPTPGRVPTHTPAWHGLLVAGPIASTVRDAALMLDVLAGTGDLRAAQPPPQKLRIALSTKSPAFIARPSAEIRDSVNATAAILRDAGHSLIEADPPYPATLANLVLRMWTAVVATNARELRWEALEKRTRTMAGLGRRFGPPSPAAIEAWASRAGSWFRDFDALLMPTVAKTSIPAGTWTGKGFLSTLLPQVLAYPYTGAWNMAGFAAASVPVGVARDGVPIGVQLVVPSGREATLLSLAVQLEAVRPWPRLKD